MPEYENQSFKKGSHILEEGSSPENAYVIKTGVAQVIKSRSDGKQAVIGTLKKGDLFGEMSLVDSEPRSASVVALEDLEVIVIDPITFRLKQESLDKFTQKLVQTLIIRLREQNIKLADLTNPSTLAKAVKKGQIELGKSAHTSVLIRENYRDSINFAAIRFLLADANPQSRQGIKGGLHLQGFREIEDVNAPNDFSTRVASSDYDLIMVDCNLGAERVAEVIDNIRHGKTSVSPYAVIFAVIETPDPKTLDLLSGAGLDDVLVKPVALGNVLDRIERRLHKRKPFVVTIDYVGPDRRSTTRPGKEVIPLVEVPNPIAFKAMESIDTTAYLNMTEAANARIEVLKIERHVVQIDWLRNKIRSLLDEGKDPSYFMNHTLTITGSLIIKLEKKEDDRRLKMCQDILTMMEEFQSGMRETSGSDWETYSKITETLRNELGPKV